MKILIVGAGIGGLTLASALKQRGLEAQVIERAPSLKAVGAGITIQANAMAVLEQLGFAQAFKGVGTVLAGGLITDEQGRVISRIDFSAKLGQSIALHRHELHQILYQPVQGQVRLGCGLEGLQQLSNTVEAQFSDGSKDHYELVVGADGIRSVTRRMIFGNLEPHYAGYASWRFVVQSKLKLANPIEIWGRGVRLGLVDIGQGKIYGFTTFNQTKGSKDLAENRLERLHQWFGGFGGVVPQVLNSISSPSQLIPTEIEELSLPLWFKNRVVLLGDAAHAMTPNLGQGAGMAIEDAYVLAAQLATQTLPNALKNYQQLRQKRVQQIQTTARLLGQVGQWSWGPAVALRNGLLRATPERINRQRIEALLSAGPV